MRIGMYEARDVRTGGLFGDPRDASAGDEHQGDQPGAQGQSQHSAPSNGNTDQHGARGHCLVGYEDSFGDSFVASHGCLTGPGRLRKLAGTDQDVCFRLQSRRYGAHALTTAYDPKRSLSNFFMLA